MLAVNYTWEIEDNYVYPHLDKPVFLLFYLGFYPLVYYLAVVAQHSFASVKYLHSRKFWITSGFFLLVLAFEAGFYWHRHWLQGMNQYQQYFFGKLLHDLLSSSLVLFPLLVYWVFNRRYLHGFFGLQRSGHRMRPYLWMLLIMLPFIVWAGGQPDFQETYPFFQYWKLPEAFGIPKKFLAVFFEAVYLLDFIRVEVFFRGAMVIALARIMGKEAILPMAVLYMSYHFDKPLAEAISSFFGGYLLGTIAHYHKHILGGCIVHMGIAALMEVVGYLYHYLG